MEQFRHEKANAFQRKEIDKGYGRSEIFDCTAHAHAVASNVSHVPDERDDDFSLDVGPVTLTEGRVYFAQGCMDSF